jgi:hypothetical protein
MPCFGEVYFGQGNRGGCVCVIPMVRTPAAAALGLVAVLGLGLEAGCGQTAGTGIVTGRLPLCYGPGPNLNLTPTVVVQAFASGQLVRRRTFKASKRHGRYELSLPQGQYQLRAGSQSVRATVRAHGLVHADFRQPGCA